jgi:hypothetical protein
MNGLDDAEQVTIVGMDAAGDIDRIRMNAVLFTNALSSPAGLTRGWIFKAIGDTPSSLVSYVRLGRLPMVWCPLRSLGDFAFHCGSLG